MPYLEVDLQDFLRTGKFGPISLGMTKPQIEELLGAPQNWGGVHAWWPRDYQNESYKFQWHYSKYPIWVYDAIEFHFGEQDELFLIWCDYLEKLQAKGIVFQINRWVFADAQPLTKERMAVALQQVALSYTYKQFEFGAGFTLASGVELGYSNEDNQVVSIGIHDDRYYQAAASPMIPRAGYSRPTQRAPDPPSCQS